MAEYLKRILDDELDFYLDTFGAVLLRGPKWCGKTTTAERHAKSTVKMLEYGKTDERIKMANTDIGLILDGEQPRLIDEWQVAPAIWDNVRSLVDSDNTPGQFILTGSRIPAENSHRHSGAGRFGVLNMYPMSLFESRDSNGKISLKRMMDGAEIDACKSPLTVKHAAECLCRGGWPANLGMDCRKYSVKLKSYMDLIYESDDISLKKYAKDVNVAKEIVRSYSRNVSTLASMKTIYNDVIKGDISISEAKFFDYVASLRNTYVICDVPAWNPSVRSKDSMRSTPKRELVDPSIAALYLGMTPENFTDDFNTFGLLFESMCIRDLRAYSSIFDGEVLYYHDKYGLETDAVIKSFDGRYGLAEIKLGSNEIDNGAENLCKLEDLLEKNGFKKPSFKMVLTCTETSYRRQDGVCVVPVGCLGP